MKNEMTKKGGLSWIRLFVVLFLMLLAAVLASDTFGKDFMPIIRWWGILIVIGAAFYPLTACLFSAFEDKGYLFSKAVGIVVSGWLMWLLASCHILKFTHGSCFAVLILCAICNYGGFALAAMHTGKTKDRNHNTSGKGKTAAAGKKSLLAERAAEIMPDWNRVALLELLFFLIFLSFMYIKGFNAKAYGTEKMMDYGFMTSIYRTDYFPVNDFWFTGESLNYYYFGQYLMTFLTKLSLNSVSYGYNLALGMGFAFCLTLVYALVYQILKINTKTRTKKEHTQRYKNRVAHFGGALAALAVGIAGNGHYIIFNKLVPMLWDILQIPGDKPSYWFPDSTRYIGYMPDTADKTIHEFPSYSFVLGDLHAHVINITFVLTVLGILFAFLMKRNTRMCEITAGAEPVPWNWKKEIVDIHILMLGFMLGIFMMTNYWDFPIYYVVSGAVILVSNAVVSGFKMDTLKRTALHAVVIFGIAQIIALPFNINFEAMTNGIALASTHTLFYQLVVLWGLPVLVVIGFAVSLIRREYLNRRECITIQNSTNCREGAVSQNGTDDPKKTVTAAKRAESEKKSRVFFAFLEHLSIADLFVLILGLCAIGLVLMPELVYVVDIYGGSYKRSNTMFKLVYQAFILFGISMGYVITRFICYRESKTQWKGGVIAAVVLCLTFGYFTTSCQAWFGDISKEENYGGIEADQYIYTEAPADAAAIDWLQTYAQDGQVVLEANGDSYTLYNRVSVLTGLPTVLGWHTHEWLWHNDVTPVGERAEDIQSIYTSQDETLVRGLLEQYDVSYIFIGSCEYEKYGTIGMDVEFLKSLGEVVYEGYPDENNRIVYILQVSD